MLFSVACFCRKVNMSFRFYKALINIYSADPNGSHPLVNVHPPLFYYGASTVVSVPAFFLSCSVLALLQR